MRRRRLTLWLRWLRALAQGRDVRLWAELDADPDGTRAMAERNRLAILEQVR